VIDKLKKDLSFKFEMKDLGKARMVLSMEIERDWKGDKISFTQKGIGRSYFRNSISTTI